MLSPPSREAFAIYRFSMAVCMSGSLNGAHCLHVYRNVLLHLLAEEMLLHEGSAFLLALHASLLPITSQSFAPLVVARIQSAPRRADILSQ